MKAYNQTRKSAFTLTELIFATTISGLVLAVVMTVFISALSNTAMMMDKLNFTSERAFSLRVMDRDMSFKSNLVSVNSDGFSLSIPSEDQPQLIRYAFVVTEDKNGQKTADLVRKVYNGKTTDAELESSKTIVSGIVYSDTVQPKVEYRIDGESTTLSQNSSVSEDQIGLINEIKFVIARKIKSHRPSASEIQEDLRFIVYNPLSNS